MIAEGGVLDVYFEDSIEILLSDPEAFREEAALEALRESGVDLGDGEDESVEVSAFQYNVF